MAKIRIDIESLQNSSARLSERIAELENLNARLEALISRIEASWEGQASFAYLAMMRRHAEKARKMVDVLTEYKKYVDSAIHKFTNVDKSSAARIRASF